MARSPAEAVHIVPPDGPTQEVLTRWMAETTPKVKGRIVLVGRHTMVPVSFNKSPLRRDDEELRRQYQSDGGPVPQGPQGPRGNAAPAAQPGQLGATAVGEQIDAMLVAAGRAGPASTTPAAITARFAPSTTARSISPKRCRRWCCATRTTAGSSRILADGTPGARSSSPS